MCVECRPTIVVYIRVAEITKAVAVRVCLVRVGDGGTVITAVTDLIRGVSIAIGLIRIRRKGTVILAGHVIKYNSLVRMREQWCREMNNITETCLVVEYVIKMRSTSAGIHPGQV